MEKVDKVNKKVIITEIIKIVICIALVPLLFVKYMNEVAILPSADGSTHRTDYYFSIYTKLLREDSGYGVFVWIAVAVIAASIVLTVLSIVYDNKKQLKLASNIAFSVAATLFLILLFVAESLIYVY